MHKPLSHLVLGSLFVCLGARAANTETVPLYQITTAVTTKAINYLNLSAPTKIGFRGTTLLPEASGEATVSRKQGSTVIEARFRDLKPATRFGPAHLTYVLWAISPEGRATNLGELVLDGGQSRLTATTQLQAFGLIVTAEPYFAMTQVGDTVVLENFARKDTVGKIHEIEAKYELMPRGQYTLDANPADLKPMAMDPDTSPYLYQARSAVKIAAWTGAENHAADTFKKASDLLQQAELYQKGKRSLRKQVSMLAREAIQTAEDARLIALKRMAKKHPGEETSGAAISPGREGR